MGPQTFPLNGDDIMLGRGSQCHIQLADMAISRQHARLRHAQGSWFLQDQNSGGGTRVNGQPIQATRLNSGDQIEIGSTILVFYES